MVGFLESKKNAILSRSIFSSVPVDSLMVKYQPRPEVERVLLQGVGLIEMCKQAPQSF